MKGVTKKETITQIIIDSEPFDMALQDLINVKLIEAL